MVALLFFSFLPGFHPASANQVQSVNPIFTEQNIVLMPQAVNRWLNHQDHNFQITIKRTGDNFYLLQYGDTYNPSKYEAVFVSIGNAILLDIAPIIPDTLGDGDYRKQILPMHSFYKVKIENNSLELSELNYEWFVSALSKNRLLFPHTWVSDGLLITASSGELYRFIGEHLNDSSFFNEAILFERISTGKMDNKQIPLQLHRRKMLPDFNQPCLPEFPHKDGWLGGDADISVPLNDSQSLFLFADSFVGGKNETRRSFMVSGTAAIFTCSPGGRKDINYYWRNMYTPNAGPIFKSLTPRYSLWVTNAFMYENNLYVLLQKTGAKTNPDPDDFFNFNPVGFVIARVINPLANTPDEWEIEYIPISFFNFSSSMAGLHITLVKDDKYAYFFTEKESAARVFRVGLNFIDSPENHYEYYSLAHTWKPGVNPRDMEIVLPAPIGSTINFHDDLKKWVMVCGPGFMNNKIGIRTAKSLTGPWSEQTVVYECPEITPGTVSYHPLNHCYMARECVWNYDKINRTMIITYDINNKDFSVVLSNPKIYTPKVISIPLTKYNIR